MVMSTSVKMDERAKRILDALQAQIVLSTGSKLSQQEILEEAIKFSSERGEEFIRRIAGVKIPLSQPDIDRLMKIPIDFGIRTREEEIDETLYGRRPRRK